MVLLLDSFEFGSIAQNDRMREKCAENKVGMFVQAGRGTTRKQMEWLILHNRLQYIADVLCSCENFKLAFDLACDPDLPIAGPPVLLRWAQSVIDLLGTDSAACLAFLRKQLDTAAGVDWATVAGYALVRPAHYSCSSSDCLKLRTMRANVLQQRTLKTAEVVEVG